MTAAAGNVGGACTVALGSGPVHLDPAQLANARIIVAVADRKGLPEHAAVVALTTAMQESSLTNLDHGDLAGPNSRGLFQQQPAFYPGVDVTDPAGAAAAFYDRLVHVPGWQAEPIWQAAQAVQHSADPSRYIHWQALGQTLAAALHNRPTPTRCTAGDPAAGPGGPVNTRIAAVLAAARQQLGQPYVWGGGDASGPTRGVDGAPVPGFDCSGLMIYVWARAGISLPHSSFQQYDAGPHVPVAQARPGDLIFLGTNPADPATIHHVALVYTPGQIIEAQTFGVPVHVRTYQGPAEGQIMPDAVRLIS